MALVVFTQRTLQSGIMQEDKSAFRGVSQMRATQLWGWGVEYHTLALEVDFTELSSQSHLKFSKGSTYPTRGYAMRTVVHESRRVTFSFLNATRGRKGHQQAGRRCRPLIYVGSRRCPPAHIPDNQKSLPIRGPWNLVSPLSMLLSHIASRGAS